MNRIVSKKRNSYILRYTMMYLIVTVPLILLLLITGKSLIWGIDAYYQHYPALYSTAAVVRKLFTSGSIEMFNLSLGQGMDSLTTLAYYGFTDPFHWLGALFQGQALEIWYNALIFIFYYLGGLYFMLYIREIRLLERDDWATVIAGMIYAFCGYQLLYVTRHPFFGMGSMYLVLMLISVERIFRERKWLMMSLITLLMIISNFYLAYQTTLLVIIYIVIRLISRIGKIGVKHSAGDGFILLGSYLLGLLMSCAMLLPMAVGYLSSLRSDGLGGYTASWLHYPISYYIKLVMLFCAPCASTGYSTMQWFSPLIVFGIMLLWIRKDKDTYRNQLRAGFVVTVICLCVPLCGKIFNGMGYVSNRWTYGYAFVVCLCTAWAVPKFKEISLKSRKRMVIAALIYAGLMLAYLSIAQKLSTINDTGNVATNIGYKKYTVYAAIPIGALALAVCALAIWRIPWDKQQSMRTLALLTTGCCMVYTLSCGFMATLSKESQTRGVEKNIQNETAAAAAAIEDDGFYRVDTGAKPYNHAEILGYYDTSYYWSVIPSWVAQHSTNLELSTQRWTFWNEGLCSDSYLSALAAVGYAVRPQNDDADALPSDCEYIQSMTQEDGDVIDIYRYQNSLPLGYMFDSSMSEEDYAQLDPVSKRQALVSCAVVDEAEADIPTWETNFEIKELDWQASNGTDAKLEGNVLSGKADGTIEISFEAEADNEVYLWFEGTTVLSLNDDKDLCIYAQSEAGASRGYFILPGSVNDYAQTGVCLRLGCSENGLKGCTLKFKDDGELSFESLKVISVPTDYCRNAVEEIRANGLWDAEVESDYVHGSITANCDGIMQIAIPYSDGWTATVDGKETEIVRCGGMYMGVALDAGTHEVEIRYETPYLCIGIYISLAAFGVAAALYIFTSVRRRKTARAK